MTEANFIEKNSAIWRELEETLRKPARGFQDIESRMRLYRVVGGHYSYAQTYYAGSSLCDYLGKLTAEAHAAVYVHHGRRSLRAFFTRRLPQLLQLNLAFIVTAAGVFLLAALLAFCLGLINPNYAKAFLPEAYQSISVEDIQANDSGENGTWSPAIMSNQIMVNNIRVTVLAFGLGLTCGLGTLYVLATNGAMLGALAALYTLAGKTLLFWSLILPHGVWELTAIFIAGGAGLKIGYSLIRPGPYRRSAALISAARNALGLLALVVIMLIAAGLVEGFFTPAAVSPGLKLAFAGGTAVVLVLYFIFAKRAANFTKAFA